MPLNCEINSEKSSIIMAIIRKSSEHVQLTRPIVLVHRHGNDLLYVLVPIMG